MADVKISAATLTAPIAGDLLPMARVGDIVPRSVSVFVMPSWTIADRPAAPSQWQEGYNTTLGYPEIWTGSVWQLERNATIPAGTVSQILGASGVANVAVTWTLGTGTSVSNDTVNGQTLNVGTPFIFGNTPPSISAAALGTIAGTVGFRYVAAGSGLHSLDNSFGTGFRVNAGSVATINFIQVTAGVAGSGVTLAAFGADASIDLYAAAKGGGTLHLQASGGAVDLSGASAILFSGSDAVAAGTLAAATVIVNYDSTVTNVAVGTYVIVKPIAGNKNIIRNRTGVTINVLPPVGGRLENLAINAAYLIYNGATVTITMKTTTQGRID